MNFTKEQTEDFEVRSKAFELAYQKLCVKHKCELVPVPNYIRGPGGVWVTGLEIHTGDTKFKLTESPIAEMMS